MKKNFDRDYYLGLDMGTESVGWAVTDPDYNLLKLNGKAMWGVRLFEAGKTAVDRRMFRASVRRSMRKKQRIDILQEFFDAEIAKTDPAFFLRLNESTFVADDKTEVQPYSLFNDGNFTDKQYHTQYPTIYHLRYALISDRLNSKTPNSAYARLVYLAVANILKTRGHFLFGGQKLDTVPAFADVFTELNQELYDKFNFMFNTSELERVSEIIKDKMMHMRDKKKELTRLLCGGITADSEEDTKITKNRMQSIISLFCGSGATLGSIFAGEYSEEDGKAKIEFAGGKYDDMDAVLENLLGENKYYTDKIKLIYDWALLADILGNNSYLSQAKIAVYEKHKKDLAVFKKFVKANFPETRSSTDKDTDIVTYNDMFYSPEKACNYCAYIGTARGKNGKKIVLQAKTCIQEDFCKAVYKLVQKYAPSDAEEKRMFSELEAGVFLPKQKTKNNSVIPYQIHKKELHAILTNASQRLPFLNEKDEKGISVAEKIEMLMTFRIPYYVGPLNDSHKALGSNCWIAKKTNEKIRPWNFEDTVDIEKSAEQFIYRMTSKCTYLVGENVLPKNSLLYSRYSVLNELNNLRVNNIKISVEQKQKIYKEVFENNRTVKMKKIRACLQLSASDEISGADGDFKSNLQSYIDFRPYADKLSDDEIESIIADILIFGEDKKMLRRRLKNSFAERLSDADISAISKLKYSGWGALSSAFLNDIEEADTNTGEVRSIISSLWSTNENLMQLLSSAHTYSDTINKINLEKNGMRSNIDYDMVSELYVSPAVRRSIWQTLQIVREIRGITQKPPKKIFVEVAREDAEKKRTKSRKDTLLDLYSNCKDDSRDWKSEIKSHTDDELRSDKLYLYYTQMGRCMYTGERIDIEKLLNDKNVYDIDHIFPQSKVKDDSLENRVLSLRTANEEKSDTVPVFSDWQAKMHSFWAILHDKKLIGDKKFERLTRTTPLSPEELADFIARQLVETRQSTKAVAECLKEVFPESDIVYSKAGNVADFKQQFEFIKVREINDLHHAKDAYLNIVVGNVYNTKFTKNPLNFIKEKSPVYSLRRMYDFDVARGGTVAWKTGENGTLATVRKTMSKNNIQFTRFSFEVSGGFFNQNLVKKGSGQFPRKGADARFADISRYGGYNSVSGAYFALVSHIEKNTRVKSLESVPIYLKAEIANNPEVLTEYLKTDAGLIEPIVLMPKIKINSLFVIDGFPMHLSGRTGVQLVFKGAMQLVVDEYAGYLKNAIKVTERKRETDRLKKSFIMPLSCRDITKEKNLEIYDAFVNKLSTTKYKVRLSAQIKTLTESRDKFISLLIEEQCTVLTEILFMFACNPVAANLSLLGKSSSAGIIHTSKYIDNYDSVKIVNQSPTGLFENEVDLKAL